MNYVYHFIQHEASDSARTGGKGANLARLTAAGFPVPAGFTVGVDAYQAFIKQCDVLDEYVERFAYAEPALLARQCAELRTVLDQQPLPAAAEAAVCAALADFARDQAWSVRSSATCEDGAAAAFAGQHDTFLNVQGVDAVLAHIKACWLSLWNDRAVLYRHQHGIEHHAAQMAVVVQQLIPCAVAGVAFGINPVNGHLDELVIDANLGLGESVVAGEAPVDHWVLDRATLAVREAHIAHKQYAVVPNAAGTHEVALSAAEAAAPCLTTGQLARVGALVQQATALYGWPQDIEWGWCSDELYLLQSRPITTVPPRWTRDESAERFPNPMTPLVWDFLQEGFDQALAIASERLSLPSLKPWFAMHDNYIYGNQNAVALLGQWRPIQACSLDELVAELPLLRKRFQWLVDLPAEWLRDLDRYLLALGRLQARPLDQLDVPALWAHVHEVNQVGKAYFAPNITISLAHTMLHRVLLHFVTLVCGAERAPALVDVLCGATETRTALVNRDLQQLAQLAASLPSLHAVLLAGEGQALLDQGFAAFPTFAARWQRFMDDYGHRELDMDYYQPTWQEQPSVVLDQLTVLLRAGDRPNAGTHASSQRQRQFEAEQRFLAHVPAPLQFFVHELIRLARVFTELDDLEHFETTRLNVEVRRAALVLGARLHAAGLIDQPDDLFFLERADMEQLIAVFPNEPRTGYRERAAAARQRYRHAWTQTPAVEWGVASTPMQHDHETLRGIAGSLGIATGPVFKVYSPADFGRFPPKAILVARTTSPAWTTLFYSAAAVIVESGGPLSHGAVTARELGLPAVMAVHGALDQLNDGQIVTVDGGLGEVMLVDVGELIDG